MTIRRDYSTKRWRRGAALTRGVGRCYLLALYVEPESTRASYAAVCSLRQAKAYARVEVGVPLHWRDEGDALVGYYLARHQLPQPRLFEVA